MAIDLLCPYCGHHHLLDDTFNRIGLIRCEHCRKRFIIETSEMNQFKTERARELDRYQIITYDRDGGADEKWDYQELSAAIVDAQKLLNGKYDGVTYEGVIVYDLKEWKILREYGYWPDNERPREGKPVCKQADIPHQFFGIVRWTTEDVIAAAEAQGTALTEAQALQWWEQNERSFKDLLTVYGNEILSNMVYA